MKKLNWFALAMAGSACVAASSPDMDEFFIRMFGYGFLLCALVDAGVCAVNKFRELIKTRQESRQDKTECLF